MAPPSQKNRPITIDLDGARCDLTLRPEDLTWSEPSRISVHQTLGGAWVDAFGPGVATINLSGHTGWQGGDSGVDWLTKFKELRGVAFTGWHEKVEASRDPESVRMFFIDALDERVARIVPGTFTLKRNKSRPLLIQYQISFSVIEDGGGSGGGGGGGLAGLGGGGMQPLAVFEAAQSSMGAARNVLAAVRGSVSSATGWLRTATSIANGDMGSLIGVINRFAGSELSGVINEAVGIAHEVTGMVQAGAEFGKALSSDLASVATNTCEATAQALHNVSANLDAPGSGSPDAPSAAEQALISHAASTLHGIVCLIRNGFNGGIKYQTYDEVYGASTCSSTSGGRPISPLIGQNPFEYLMGEIVAPQVAQSAEAVRSARVLMRSDPVLYPLSNAEVALHMAALTGGTRFVGRA